MAEADEPIYLEDRTAGAYLTQAHDALKSCGDVSALYGPRAVTPGMSTVARSGLHIVAQSAQLDFARTSILFSALAGEAYINGFLGANLQRSDFEAVERLTTLDKFILGPELVLGRRLFERGSEPGQSLKELFTLRHTLVHPKMGPVRVDGNTLIDERFTRFNPKSAADFLIAVADAARVLAASHEPPAEPDAIVEGIRGSREKLIGFGTELRKGLPPPRELPADPQPYRYRRRRDPFSVPTIVPHEAQQFLESIRSTAGTATMPATPEVPTPPRDPE